MTINPYLVEAALGVYIVLLAAGGAIGYLKAKSRPSLIAGVGSALIGSIGLGLALSGRSIGFRLSLVVAALLTVVFSIRLFKTRKFMPGGLLFAVSLAMTALLSAFLFAPQR